MSHFKPFYGNWTEMLILGLNAKFLGLGIFWPWPSGLSLECPGLGINNKANYHII